MANPVTGAAPLAAVATRPLDLHTYRWVLIVHSEWRWIVLLAGFWVVFSAAARLSTHDKWAPTGPKLGKFFSVAIDIQVLLGAALYLVLSPLTTVVLSSAGARLPPGSQAHFFAVVHPALMIAAFIAVHIASILVRRARSDAGHHRRALIFYGVTLLIVLAGIPWWRPWLRF